MLQLLSTSLNPPLYIYIYIFSQIFKFYCGLLLSCRNSIITPSVIPSPVLLLSVHANPCAYAHTNIYIYTHTYNIFPPRIAHSSFRAGKDARTCCRAQFFSAHVLPNNVFPRGKMSWFFNPPLRKKNSKKHRNVEYYKPIQHNALLATASVHQCTN